jgi:beta-glucosidase
MHPAPPTAQSTAPAAQPTWSQAAQAALRDGFVWGAATSAYQIEGAVTEDGRGASIWDTFCAEPGRIHGGDSGAVACDHYHRWSNDLDLLCQLGLGAYRFSVAWPRVQPLGHGAFNPAGLDFYERLVDGLLARGIQPHATLYHWDLPQALQDQGGWGQRATASRFADYAVHVGRRLGDRLSTLATHNEPWCTAWMGHATGQFAPGLRDEALAVQASHHLLLSHGAALQGLRAAGLRCPLGIVLNQSPATAATGRAEDQHIAGREYARMVRWYMDPLLRGRYPAQAELPLPRAEPGDMALIQTPLDFLGINYYTRIWASSQGLPAPCALGRTDMGWEVYPDGLRELLQGIHAAYKLPPLFIMENGMANAPAEGLNDTSRIDYLHRHLEALAQARAAGVDVRGYFAWSLLDNFEWDSGYAKRFGLVDVDYTTQQRTPKASFHWLRGQLQTLREAAHV